MVIMPAKRHPGTDKCCCLGSSIWNHYTMLFLWLTACQALHKYASMFKSGFADFTLKLKLVAKMNYRETCPHICVSTVKYSNQCNRKQMNETWGLIWTDLMFLNILLKPFLLKQNNKNVSTSRHRFQTCYGPFLLSDPLNAFSKLLPLFNSM